jgi:hypothetical protein
MLRLVSAEFPTLLACPPTVSQNYRREVPWWQEDKLVLWKE